LPIARLFKHLPGVQSGTTKRACGGSVPFVAAAAANADAVRLQAGATKDGLLDITLALGSPEAALRYEALRQYTEGTAALASSPNTKTLVLPRGDEWLSRVGIALEKV
jgi:hypothetical protein